MIVKTKRIDTKHSIVLEEEGHGDTRETTIYLAKRLVSGGLVRIPDEEPTIVFRGRDRLVLPLLESYRHLCVADGATDHQLESIDAMIRSFAEFALSYPDRIPGITRGR